MPSDTSQEQSTSAQGHTLGLIILALGPFSLGYFLSYLFRAVNAVVEADLVREIALSPSELGLMTAAYLGAFALFQLPLGVLLDRFGPRRVQTCLMTVAACGALLFAVGKDALTLTIARAIIGIGVAGGLMAGFKSVVIWVAEPRRALANAFVMSAGAIGLLVATRPVQEASDLFGWRNVFFALAAITFVVALIIFLVVPEKRGGATPEKLSRQIAEIGGIFCDRGMLALAPLLGLTAGVHIAIQTLWAAPWLRDVMGLARDEVATYLFYMAAAFFFGILFSGAIADWFVRRGVSLLTVMLGFIVIYIASQVGIVFQYTEYALPMWLVFGMLGQVAILAYPWLASHFGAARSGRAQTAMNLMIFGCAFASQYAIGEIIELYPQPTPESYSTEAFKTAFGVFLGLQLLALVWYLANWRVFKKST